MNGGAPSGLSGLTLNLLRIMAGFAFFLHGGQKIFGMFGGNSVELMSQMGLAGVLELVGGIMIMVGLFTRPVAFILAGEMAVAYFMAHVPNGGILPIQNRGESAFLFCFIFLFLFANGGGSMSLDGMRKARGQAQALE